MAWHFFEASTEYGAPPVTLTNSLREQAWASRLGILTNGTTLIELGCGKGGFHACVAGSDYENVVFFWVNEHGWVRGAVEGS